MAEKQNTFINDKKKKYELVAKRLIYDQNGSTKLFMSR